MKAINKNLSLLFITLLSVSVGGIISLKNVPQQIKEYQNEGLVLIDKFGVAMTIERSFHQT